jgi:hypothetical protein
MMKHFLILIAVAMFMASCGNENTDKDTKGDSTQITKVNIPTLTLAEFDKKAAEFVGKEIQIKSVCDHVCRHSGKKLFLVDGDYSLHVVSDTKFDEALSGSVVTVNGIVEEERIDSAFIAETLKHDIGSSGGGTKEDKLRIKESKEWAKMMTDSLKNAGVDHFSNYSLKFVSLEDHK